MEMIVNFLLTIMNSTVHAVESFRLLDTTVSQDLKWDNHIGPCIYPEWAKGLAKSLWTAHIQPLKFGPLTSSTLPLWTVTVWSTLTELSAPERPDTETVSFPKQSISWTLDIKHGTHNTIMQLFIHHTYLFFHFNLHMSDLTHIYLYFCHFVHCLSVYYSFIISVFSCCCHSVAL